MDPRVEAFGEAVDALRREIDATLGADDVAHIRRIGRWSSRLEIAGRTLIHVSLEPLSFGLGVGALWVHKCLELMEIGHTSLHGTYDALPGAEAFRAEGFRWKAPIDEASWRIGHNVRHHQHTNIAGKDPDLNFGGLRLSPRVAYRRLHKLQPVTNLMSWLGFASGINLHVSGMLDVYLNQGEPEVVSDRSPESARTARRVFLSKTLRYYGREYVFFPLLAGPFFWKTLLGNLLSEVGRDVYAAAVIYCGHVGATDYPAGTEPAGRAEWYVMQVEAARDVEVPLFVSILGGALDKQIEHHLFPRLPPNRLREIAPRVRALCEAHGVRYRSASWPATLRDVLATLAALRHERAEPATLGQPAQAQA